MLAEIRLKASQLARSLVRRSFEVRCAAAGLTGSMFGNPTGKFRRVKAYVEPELAMRHTPGSHPLVESLRANPEIVGRLIDAP